MTLNSEIATSISINGGPAIKIDLAKLEAATDTIRGGKITPGGTAAERLQSLVDRIENLEAEKKDTAESIKGVYAEAKGAGFDVEVLRNLIKVRSKEPAEVEEQETLLDVYRNALGM